MIRPYLCGDIVIGNQEVPIGGEELGVSGTAYSFNAPVAIAEQLPQVGFDVLTLSNNHSYDRGYEGAVNTLENLRANDILPVGLYADETSAEQIAIVEENGIRIAILAYTYDTNIAPEDSHAFVTKTFLNEQGQLDDAHRQMLKEDVEQAQEQADVVIAAMHWGNEFTFERNAAQTQTAAYLNDLGVDIIIGNHPHCLQTMERLTNAEGKETWVFYSLGNLVSAAAMVDRASVDFANLYEMGGIVNLDVVIDGESGEVRIEHARLTPVINHFDVNYSHFQLIPLRIIPRIWRLPTASGSTRPTSAKHGWKNSCMYCLTVRSGWIFKKKFRESQIDFYVKVCNVSWNQKRLQQTEALTISACLQSFCLNEIKNLRTSCPEIFSFKWWTLRDSNPRPTD